MDDIGDFKSIRKNLMLVSVTTLFLIVFRNHISEINLGIVKFEQGYRIFEWVPLVVMITVNAYVLLRYVSYFWDRPLKIPMNQLAYLYLRWINPNRIKKIQTCRDQYILDLETVFKRGEQKFHNDLLSIDEDYLTVGRGLSYMFRRPLDTSSINCEVIYVGDEVRIFYTHYQKETANEEEGTREIIITLDRQVMIDSWKKFVFIFAEKHYADYMLPICIGFASITFLISSLLFN